MGPTPEWLLPLAFCSLLVLLTGLVIGVAKNHSLKITHPGVMAILTGALVGGLITLGLIVLKLTA